MEFEAARLKGLYVVRFEPRTDFRGAFTEVWNAKAWLAAGLPFRIDQVNVSESTHRGTVRGMHWQDAPHGQKKIVRCIRGAVFDVAVDIRPGSPTYGDWAGIELHDDSNLAFYIPEGFAHGFQTLVNNSEVLYQMSAPYVSESARGVRWNDPAFGIDWPPAERIIIARDQTYPDFTG